MNHQSSPAPSDDNDTVTVAREAVRFFAALCFVSGVLATVVVMGIVWALVSA